MMIQNPTQTCVIFYDNLSLLQISYLYHTRTFIKFQVEDFIYLFFNSLQTWTTETVLSEQYVTNKTSELISPTEQVLLIDGR